MWVSVDIFPHGINPEWLALLDQEGSGDSYGEKQAETAFVIGNQ